LGGAQLFVPDVLGTLTARMMNALGARDIEDGAVLPMAFAQNQLGEVRTGDVTNTLNTNSNASGRNTPMVAQPITQFGDVAGSLTARHDSSPCADRGQNVVAQPVCFQQNTRDEVRYINGDGQIAGALAAESGMKQTNYVAQPYVGGVDYENNAHTMEQPTGPLLKGSPTGGGRPLPAIATAMQVRRLTPVECERLQGFPDNYTNIPWRKKSDAPDGPRYKALGNSMAVPVMQWLGERIAAVESIDDEKKAP
jgi:hypothetical protein